MACNAHYDGEYQKTWKVRHCVYFVTDTYFDAQMNEPHDYIYSFISLYVWTLPLPSPLEEYIYTFHFAEMYDILDRVSANRIVAIIIYVLTPFPEGSAE